MLPPYVTAQDVTGTISSQCPVFSVVFVRGVLAEYSK